MPDRMKCPKCGIEMQKAGAGHSGNREVQLYRCGNRNCKDFAKRIMNSKENYIREEK